MVVSKFETAVAPVMATLFKLRPSFRRRADCVVSGKVGPDALSYGKYRSVILRAGNLVAGGNLVLNLV